MSAPYKPNMAGFSERLGLKNGIYDLVNRPVPKQEILYYNEDDVIDVKDDSQYNRQKNFYSRSRRWKKK